MSALMLPPEYHALAAEKTLLLERSREVSADMHRLRRIAIDAIGWTRCCRCFPSVVSDDGFCGCCEYNHVTKQSLRDPEHDEESVRIQDAPRSGT